MGRTPDAFTLFFTGELLFFLLLAVVLTWPVCWALLTVYRRAVKRSMAARTSRAEHESEPASRSAPFVPGSVPPPVVATIDASVHPAGDASADALFRDLLARPWRTARIYALAGLAYAVILALVTGWLTEPDAPFRPLRFLMLAVAFAWPVVPTVSIVAGSVRQWKVRIASAYAIVYLAIAVVAVVAAPEFSIGQAVLMWALFNVPTLVLLWFCLSRRIRAVGPMVLLFLILGFSGTDVLLRILASSDSYLMGAVSIADRFGFGAVGTFLGIMIVGFAAFAVIGAVLLSWIRRRYEAKRLSDESLTIHTIWWLYAYGHVAIIVFQHPLTPLAGLAAMVAFITVTRTGFRRVRTGDTGQKLLLLRSFSIGPRGERLFDALEKHWRRIGSVQMIAGADLATRTIEPHEFLDFVAGKLARRFIDGDATLSRRLAEMDVLADRDGRFRVNDFFCYDDTWRMVLSSLVRETDAVLMDLRGFSRRNAGCVFEIGELFRVVPLERVLFVVDRASDMAFLSETFGRAAAMASHAGAADASSLKPRLLTCESLNVLTLRTMLRALSTAASPGAVAARV